MVNIMDLTKRAKAYAKTSILFFDTGNTKLAAKYWNKIYSLNLPFEVLINTMRLFSDEQVYTITDYIRNKYYLAMGLR